MSISGRIDPQVFFAAILAISVTGTVTDLLWGRIFNWLTLPGAFLGVIAATYYGGWGWEGFVGAAAGLGAGFLAYSWIWLFRMMGAGDVKFLMAFGAWGGLHFALEVALLGVLIGGVLAALQLAAKGRLTELVGRLRRFVFSLLIRELELEIPRIDRKLTMPYGPAIAAAALWVAWAHPLDGFLRGVP